MNEEAKLELEAQRATEFLKGKIVAIIWRHRKGEVAIQFTDGTRLFVDHNQDGVELSITDMNESSS